MGRMAYSLVVDRGNKLQIINETHRIKIQHSFQKMKALNNTVTTIIFQFKPCTLTHTHRHTK
jgi:hypothetical protein